MSGKFLIGLMALCAAPGVGWATMFTGSSQQITVSSQPPGARVSVSGGYSGVTPLALQLLTGHDNLLSPICWVVDIATGAMWRLTPSLSS